VDVLAKQGVVRSTNKELVMAKKTAKKTAKRRTTSSKMPPGKTLTLADAIAYAESGVVSRTLLENEAGTVTLFAFDAGQGLSEHTAPFDALVQVLDGEGIFAFEGKTHRVGTGQMLLMPAGVPHSVKAKKRFQMLLTMLRSKR
jgi:quercetin dioxygenase-like cupin family protein